MKQMKRQMLWNAVIALLVVGLILIHAIRSAYAVDFSAINGTFQNYNVVRRLLSGEIPYRDFTCYLGFGHLFIGSFFTFLFGGKFAGSLMAFSFLTVFSFCIVSLSLGKAVLGKSMAIFPVTLSMLVILIVQPLFYTSAGGLFPETVAAMGSALSPGNSARLIRGMVLPLSLLAAISLHNFLGRAVAAKRISPKSGHVISYLANAVISGICFIWSNDYGIACWLCALIVQVVVNIKRTKSIRAVLIGICVQLLVSIATVFVAVGIMTQGNWKAWLSSFIGTGEFQRWYFGSPHYFWDIDLSFLTLLQAVIVLSYLVKIVVGNEESLVKYAALAYSNMACYAAVNEYALFNSGDLHEMAYTVLFFTALYEALDFLKTVNAARQLKHGICSVVILAGFALFVSLSSNTAVDFANRNRGGGGGTPKPSADIRT